LFPLGLTAFLVPPGSLREGWAAMFVPVGVYLVHAIFYFRARTSRKTVIWFAVLIILADLQRSRLPEYAAAPLERSRSRTQ